MRVIYVETEVTVGLGDDRYGGSGVISVGSELGDVWGLKMWCTVDGGCEWPVVFIAYKCLTPSKRKKKNIVFLPFGRRPYPQRLPYVL